MIREEESWGQQLLGVVREGTQALQLLFPWESPQQTMSPRSGGWEQGVGQARLQEEQTPPEIAHTTFQRSLLSVCDLDPSPIPGRLWSDGGHSQSVQSAPFQGQKTILQEVEPGVCVEPGHRGLCLSLHTAPVAAQRCLPPTTVFESLLSTLWERDNPSEVSFEVPISKEALGLGVEVLCLTAQA